jgi:hypothetical protein
LIAILASLILVSSIEQQFSLDKFVASPIRGLRYIDGCTDGTQIFQVYRTRNGEYSLFAKDDASVLKFELKGHKGSAWSLPFKEGTDYFIIELWLKSSIRIGEHSKRVFDYQASRHRIDIKGRKLVLDQANIDPYAIADVLGREKNDTAYLALAWHSIEYFSVMEFPDRKAYLYSLPFTGMPLSQSPGGKWAAVTQGGVVLVRWTNGDWKRVRDPEPATLRNKDWHNPVNSFMPDNNSAVVTFERGSELEWNFTYSTGQFNLTDGKVLQWAEGMCGLRPIAIVPMVQLIRNEKLR